MGLTMTLTEISYRPLLASDRDAVARIFKQGIETKNATFETEVPSWEDWDNDHIKECRIVAEADGEVLGWAVLSPISSRCVYQGVAEVSVYVSTDHLGKKIGSTLLEQLVKGSEKAGIWSLHAGIFPENEASIHVHEKMGFRIVGIHEKIGKMDGKWRDTVLMERRSQLF